MTNLFSMSSKWYVGIKKEFILPRGMWDDEKEKKEGKKASFYLFTGTP